MTLVPTVIRDINTDVYVGEVLQAGPPISPQIPSRANVVHKAADYTVLVGDSGTTFIADAAVNFTLPTASACPPGSNWTFINGADTNMTITSAPADAMVVFNDVAADSIAFSTASEKAGNAVRIVCDGAKHYALVMLGAETATPTIAT